MPEIDEATKSILKLIPDDAKIIIARAWENHNDCDADLGAAQSTPPKHNGTCYGVCKSNDLHSVISFYE
jgi:hypothetical protein